ncbi:multidrug transporter MurJ [Borreliella chilensis]|uniref:Probable lipid II flippase MurJ n=1 Tax=Borreliella chilensis TaxID=1245910 RepID=A0A0A7UWH4_9SPIR|nr:multidrug transporter MurJ [Borreliella chilensis]
MNKYVVSTVLVMISTFFSRIMGFAKVKIFSYYFGADLDADIFNYVFNIPNNLRKILSEGAMTSAFLPEFTYEKNKSHKKAVSFFRTVITFNVISIGLIIVFMIFFAKPVMYFLSYYRGENLIFASSVFRYLVLYILLISISSIFTSALNSYKIFFIPSFSPIMLSFGIILSIFLFYDRFGIYSAVIGVIFGGFLQFLVPCINCFMIGFAWKPTFYFREKVFLNFLSRWVRMIFGFSISIVTQQISFVLASTLEIGSVSILSNAVVYYQLPVGIFYISIVTVIFPKMAEYALLGNKIKLNALLVDGIKILLLIFIPVSFMMFIWSDYILNLFLMGGKFSIYDTQKTASVLRCFLLGLLFYSMFSFFQKYYFSIRDAKTPFYLSVLFSVLDIAFSVFGISYYGLNALALAQSISFVICVIVFYFIILKSGVKINLIEILFVILRSIITLFPLYIIYYFFGKLQWDVGFSLKNLYFLIIAGIVSILILIICYSVLGINKFFNFIRKDVL